MTNIEQYECALFNEESEIAYAGYHRVSATFVDGELIEEIQFPRSQQGEPVLVTHIVALDGNCKERCRIQISEEQIGDERNG
jgi:hypothetical protein